MFEVKNEYQNEKLHKCKQIKGIPQESVKVAQPFVDFSLETSELEGNKHRSQIVFEGVLVFSYMVYTRHFKIFEVC